MPALQVVHPFAFVHVAQSLEQRAHYYVVTLLVVVDYRKYPLMQAEHFPVESHLEQADI